MILGCVGSTPLLYLQYSVALEGGIMSTRLLGQDECLACQAIWAGDVPQNAHVCLACPECHERPVGVAISVGAYCYHCGWREGGVVRLNDGD